MDKDKRILDGAITTSMRSDPPDQQAIEALQHRYAQFDKLTRKPPAQGFNSVLTAVGNEGRQDRESGSDDASPSSAADDDDSRPALEGMVEHEGAPRQPRAAPGSRDIFEPAPANSPTDRAPLPSARHPESPAPGARGKIIIKV